MKTIVILPVILFAFLSANDDGEDIECCPKKIVGGKTYIHIGKADKSEAMQFKCSSPCVYTLEGDNSEKFCFKPGQLESKCVKDSTGMTDYSTTSPRPGGSTSPDSSTTPGGSTTSGGSGPPMTGGLYALPSISC